MNQLIPWLLTNPLFFIGAILSLLACVGFLIFLRGFLLGLNHLLYIDGHDDHLDHARINSTWGISMMINSFVLWVAIRGLATLFGFDNANTSMTVRILVCYGVLVCLFYFMGFAFVKPKK